MSKKCQVKHYAVAECLYGGCTECWYSQSSHKLYLDCFFWNVLGNFQLLYHITKTLLLVSVVTNQPKQVTDVLDQGMSAV